MMAHNVKMRKFKEGAEKSSPNGIRSAVLSVLILNGKICM